MPVASWGRRLKRQNSDYTPNVWGKKQCEGLIMEKAFNLNKPQTPGDEFKAAAAAGGQDSVIIKPHRNIGGTTFRETSKIRVVSK